MKKPTKTATPGSGSRRRNSPRRSLQQFDTLMQSHTAQITEMRHSLHDNCAFFFEKGDILPVQCKRVMKSLEELNERVKESCTLLDDAESLPFVYIALRYRLLAVLHLIAEKADELIDLVDDYREVCMTSSSQARRQRMMICDMTQMLLQYIDNISQKAKFLHDEARFLEQELLAGLAKQPSPTCKSRKTSHSHEHWLSLVKKSEARIEVPKKRGRLLSIRYFLSRNYLRPRPRKE